MAIKWWLAGLVVALAWFGFCAALLVCDGTWDERAVRWVARRLRASVEWPEGQRRPVVSFR
jgi:hypothetical protein